MTGDVGFTGSRELGLRFIRVCRVYGFIDLGGHRFIGFIGLTAGGGMSWEA